MFRVLFEGNLATLRIHPNFYEAAAQLYILVLKARVPSSEADVPCSIPLGKALNSPSERAPILGVTLLTNQVRSEF